MFDIEACDREKHAAIVEQPSRSSHRGAAIVEWIPYGNRSAEVDYFFDGPNEEIGYDGKTPLRPIIWLSSFHIKARSIVLVSDFNEALVF
jgi:hypothetical protein